MTSPLGIIQAEAAKRVASMRPVSIAVELFGFVKYAYGANATAVCFQGQPQSLDSLVWLSVFIPEQVLPERLRKQPVGPVNLRRVSRGTAHPRSFLLEGDVSLYGADSHLQLKVSKMSAGTTSPVDERIGSGYSAVRNTTDRDRRTMLGKWPLRIAFAGRDTIQGYRDLEYVLHEPRSLAARGCKMAGEGTIAGLCDLMDQLDPSEFDLLVIARGGGSEVELLAFSDPALVSAAQRCPVPVLVAIGHKADRPALERAAASATTPSEAGRAINAQLHRTHRRLCDLEAKSSGIAQETRSELEEVLRRFELQRCEFVRKTDRKRRNAARNTAVWMALVVFVSVALTLRFGAIGLVPLTALVAAFIAQYLRSRGEAEKANDFARSITLEAVVSSHDDLLQPEPTLRGRSATAVVADRMHLVAQQLSGEISLAQQLEAPLLEAHRADPATAGLLHQQIETTLCEPSTDPIQRIRQLQQAQAELASLFALLAPYVPTPDQKKP